MPSPFPGMDPYLESPAVWPDLHNRFIALLSEAINAVLPPPLFCSLGSRVYVEETERRVEPDADILSPNGSANGTPSGGSGGGVAVAGAAQARPVIIDEPRDEVTEWFAEIHASPGGERLVTTIELLSPTNKQPGSTGAQKYREKQREMLDAPVNLVEIDLLRGGQHTTAITAAALRRQAGPFDYHGCVRRVARPTKREAYPFRLQDPLPVVAIPLLPGQPDVIMPLQPILARCYDTGQYARRVRYDRPPPEPALTPDQQRWVAETLAARSTPGV
jgi:hypothetical protein